MSILPCSKCGGEGRIWKSKYGGNDPDVWDAGECNACSGSGDQECEARGCSDKAVSFNDDGEALCAGCIVEWATAAEAPL